ncbi:camphor resistance protein CrcB [Bradyrhizobium lablabi]|uniref:Fluoride-specific ion channel FluC n=1 Tax=Bradyrhizobium lablabi TaxID=722472 RepID=A0A1M7E2X1_9BRAD|nr:fluoride efflux transporter CrcB [Bradyrhizobium lablabi]SHL86111.1 camphor resistance protein CrcB [Bradyrhizobium lablabi]
MTFQSCALVLLGGFFGGILRFFVSGFVGRRIGETFPWGTLVVNVSGALVIGALAGLARAQGGIFAGEMFRDLAFVGFLGGYTTVSSFCLQTLNLAIDGQGLPAAMNGILSTGLCIAAVGAGFWSVVRVLA